LTGEKEVHKDNDFLDRSEGERFKGYYDSLTGGEGEGSKDIIYDLLTEKTEKGSYRYI